MTLWIWGIALALIAAAWLLRELLRHPTTTDEAAERQQLNTAIYKERLAELTEEHAAQRLTDERFAALTLELQRNFLQDAAASSTAPKSAPTTDLLLPLTVVVAVPLAALLAYSATPQQPAEQQWQAVQQRFAPLIAVTLERQRLPTVPDELERAAFPDFTRALQRTVLAQHATNPAAWGLLGEAYLTLGVANEAVTAFNRAYTRDPRDPRHALGYAQALLVQNDGKLAADSARLLQQVLRLEPSNGGALWLLGFGAFNLGDYAQALLAWRVLLNQLDPQSEGAQQLTASIADAEARLNATPGSTPMTPSADSTEPQPPLAAAPTPAGDTPPHSSLELAVTVDLAPALAAQLAATDTLFVFAKAANGSPVPLAAVRQAATAFPIQVVLNDHQAMVADLKLSSVPAVVVSARLSKRGDVAAQPGDVQGQSPVIDLAAGSQAVAVTLDQVIQ